ncbi:MAG: sensor histidine kinase [Turicibacter sp.]
MSRFKTLRMRLTMGMAGILVMMSVMLTILSVNTVNKNLLTPITNVVDLAELTVPSLPAPIGYSTPATDLELPQTLVPTNVREVAAVISQGSRYFYWSAIFSTLVITLVGSLVMYWVLGKLLHPLEEFKKKISSINEHELSQRVNSLQSVEEINQLASSFNVMMDRLDKAFCYQKRFSSDAAHELKTPLTVLQTNLEVLALEASPTTESYQEVIEVFSKQTTRMIDLVENLFVISEQGQYGFNDKIQVDLMFEDIINELQTKQNEMNIQINLETSHLITSGNSTMLTRAFSNLIDNAIKYNNKGGSIRIRGSETEKELVIKIEDTGIGMDDEQIQHIFNPFYRVDPSRSRKIGGAGLGLAITRDIIQRHKGQISVTSTIGKGSQFEIKLPKVI